MSQQPTPDLNKLWNWVTTQVKQRITQPSLWRAMEAARPVTLEDDRLVLGFEQGMGVEAGLFKDTVNRNTIEQALEAALKRRVSIYLISGITMADWELERSLMEEARKLSQSSRQELDRSSGADSWDAVGDSIVRRYSSLTNRALPSVQAKFLDESVQTIADAYEKLMQDSSEANLRSFNRCIDRVAERSAAPHSVVAYLVLERVTSTSRQNDPSGE